jgi:quinol monooxygenase YgiN/mannose-6-phosphate isomerase-like protein (cupin superfamily)
MSPLVREVTFRARRGGGHQLSERLLVAAATVADEPGCEVWLVHRDASDPDVIRVIEQWGSSEQCEAALAREGVKENVQLVMELLIGAPEVIEGEPLGGARVLRGVSGATVFSIFDAPDLSKDAGLLNRYGLSDVPEARYVREQLNAVQSGLTHYRMAAGQRGGWGHRHRLAEEVYVVVEGGGRIKVDDEIFELARLDAVRVAPASTRELEAGPAGMELLAFGAHWPGDGELVSDWWPA